jgi:hypothetical protein
VAPREREVSSDALERRARGGLVQVDGLTTELLGVVLAGHGSWIISLPQQSAGFSVSKNQGQAPGVKSSITFAKGGARSMMTSQGLP